MIRDIEKQSKDFMKKGKDCPDGERKQILRQLTEIFSNALKHSEDKVTLAVQTYDIVRDYEIYV